RLDSSGERRDEAGTGAPGDVEPRNGVARPDRAATAALGPAHDGEEAHAAFAQPAALLACGERQVRLRPAPRPFVLGTVESGVAEPVLRGKLQRIPDAHPALLRRVDEEQAAEGPPCLSSE